MENMTSHQNEQAQRAGLDCGTAWGLIAHLAQKDGVAPLNTIAGCWRRQLDEQWTLWVNPHRESQKVGSVEVKPFHCYVEFNGWPAAHFSPRGGCFCDGEAANADTFLAAMEVAAK